MTHLLPQIHFEDNFLLATIKDLREMKERIDKLLIGLNTSLKNTAQPAKQNLFMKNGNEGRDLTGDSRKRYRAQG